MAQTADDLAAPPSVAAPGFFALAALITAVPMVAPSAAEPPSAMAQGLLTNRQQPTIAPVPAAQHFTTESGDVQFTLDRSGPAPLLRFANQDEVLALRSSAGPRGDELLKTDTGMVVLRMTSLGGVTVYTAPGSPGEAASATGSGRTLGGPPSPSGGLISRLSLISGAVSRALGRQVAFAAQGFPPAISAVAADAAGLTGEALIQSENARITQVIIIPGASPAVRRQGATLQVTVAPPLGYAGRPSAAAIAVAAR
jgi:hypothetical protein